MQHNRLIIALEGIDGAGKTTLVSLLEREFSFSLYQRTKKGKLTDWVVSSFFMKRHYMLQVPIYLLLSYKNENIPFVSIHTMLDPLVYFRPNYYGIAPTCLGAYGAVAIKNKMG